MSSRRALKAAQAIREVVSTAILLEIKDPRVDDVTVTMVEVAGDLRAAKVYVSIMGDETKQRLCMIGLESSTGYLQKRVGNRIDTRYTPRLKFVLDKGAMNSMKVTQILNEVLPEEAPASESPAGENPVDEIPSGETESSIDQDLTLSGSDLPSMEPSTGSSAEPSAEK